MDIEKYQKAMLVARSNKQPLIIKTDFPLPQGEDVLNSFNKSYKQSSSLISEEDYFYYANFKPSNLSFSYLKPVQDFLTAILEQRCGANAIRMSFVEFEPVEDSVHLDPGDIAYWHMLGTVRGTFNHIYLQNDLWYLNDTDITQLLEGRLDMSNEPNLKKRIGMIRNLLFSLSDDEITQLYPELIYQPDVFLEPGDVVILPYGCWHGVYSVGPRAGMTFRFNN